MSTIKALGCGLAAAAALLGATAAQATPFPISYNVNVRTSFGTKFADCFTFDGAGNLTVAGLPGPLTYVPGALGQNTAQFGAVSTLATAQGLGFEITFSGKINKATARIFGNDEQGDSYIVTGTVTSSCGNALGNGAAYRHP